MNWRSLKRALRRQLRPPALRRRIRRDWFALVDWLRWFKSLWGEPDYPHGSTLEIPFQKRTECPHTKVKAVRSNSGDGSPQYDFWTDVCEACGEEVGETQDD